MPRPALPEMSPHLRLELDILTSELRAATPAPRPPADEPRDDRPARPP